MQDSVTAEVIVIGAGAAGLTAAAELAAAGRSVLLLEARDRLGGRIWSRLEPGLAVPIELGAEFIHGHAAATISLLGKAGKLSVETADSHWTCEHGELAVRNGQFAQIQRAMRRIGDFGPDDLSFDAFLARFSAAELSPEARLQAHRMAEGFDAADTARASARAIAEEWTGDMLGDAPQSRPLGGYAPLLDSLAATFLGNGGRLRLQSRVEAVHWSSGQVTVAGSCLGRPFRASAAQAIVTLPLAVLQLAADAPRAVRFSPALDAKRTALAGLVCGEVLKVVLQFHSAFWERLDAGRYRDASFFHAADAPFPTFWTQLPLRAPLMVAWAGGPRVARLAARGEAEIVQQALASLTTLFDGKVQLEPLLSAAYFHDWQQDPLALGAYSYVAVGGDAARRALAEPLNATLYFAGEATDDAGEAATVNGAVASGLRAARELLR